MKSTILTIDQATVRALVYLRISQDDELQGLGVENQLARCRKTLPVGWSIVAIVDENDTSATSEKPRPRYEAMLLDLRARKYDAVMAFTQDRLTRKVEEAAALLKLVDSHGVQIAIAGVGVLSLAKGNYDARANFLTSTVNARREVEATSHRTTLNCEGRAKKGKPQGRVPFGYRRHPRLDDRGMIKLNSKGRIAEMIDVIHEPEAELIRWAADQMLSGRSLRSVTAEIEAGSIRPSAQRVVKGRVIGGGAWSASRVREMLTRPTYAGLRVYQGEILTHDDDGQPIVTTWPPILTMAQHQRLVTLFADPIRKASSMGRAPKWLLSGIATCGRCGDGSYIGVIHGSDQTAAYRCVRKDAKHRGCYMGMSVKEAEAWVALAIKTKLADPKLGEPSEDVAEQIEDLYARIGKLDAELVEIANDADLGYAEAKAMGASRRARIKSLGDEISALLPEVAQRIELDWDTADVVGRRTAINQLIRKITLYPGPKVGRKRLFTPELVEIEWR